VLSSLIRSLLITEKYNIKQKWWCRSVIRLFLLETFKMPTIRTKTWVQYWATEVQFSIIIMDALFFTWSAVLCVDKNNDAVNCVTLHEDELTFLVCIKVCVCEWERARGMYHCHNAISGCMNTLHKCKLCNMPSVSMYHGCSLNGGNILMYICEVWRHAVAKLVEALCYKPEGCQFESRMGWIFSVYLILPSHTMALGSTQPLT
jgi:hypothetical protein